MEYIGHTSDDGRKQLLLDHLNGTSKLCRENANEFWADIAKFVGQIHDIGKYTSGFQKRINGAENIRVEHAICGAKEVAKAPPKSYVPMIEYCVAGHHSGLPDGGTKVDGEEDSTLHGRMKRKTGDYSAYENEVKLEYPKDNLRELFDVSNQREIIERYSFFTRYLFSCLTDADFIDTERFVTPNTDRGMDGDFQKAYEKVCEKLNSFKIETKLQESRSIIQEQVYKSVESNANVYTLNMPTGSGKTLCSIRAALKTAIENKKKRIIYVIPYVSIIEQTAKVFEDIFGDVLPVLQHHSNYDFDDDNLQLVNQIDICATGNANIIIEYKSSTNKECFHNGVIKVFAKENAKLNITVINLLNNNSEHFEAMENILEDNSDLNYTIIDIGGKNSIQNYYSNIIGDNAENDLRKVLNDIGIDYIEAKGEAAFYGPKLDILIKPAIGNEVALSTIQLDFLLPRRFELYYIDANGEKKTPVVIHRAILGSLDRFIAMLLEETKGALPLWLAPVGINIIPVNKEYHLEYATSIYEMLKDANYRVELDDSDEKLSYKMRESQIRKIPITLILGQKEVDEKTISFRLFGSAETTTMSIEEFKKYIENLIVSKK